nr:peroxidase 64 [Ipomoea batatas]
MGGIDGPKTMKFRGQIAGLDILIMVDSGASHNFISRQLTAVLQHPLEPTTTFGVRLGDGRRAESDGKYSQLHVDLGPIAMPIDCFAFPLGGVDLILGIAWLETLGDVKANWAKLTMEFTIGDIPVQLVGDPSLARLPISLSSLDKIEDTAYCWLLWELSLSPNIQAASEISAVQKSQLTERLQQHQHIFGEPKGLPPFRANDHRITLQTGSSPYLPGEFKVEAVAEEHNDRNEMLRQLRYHLENAQNKMAKAANTKRRELQFSEGDKVLLKLRPHRQSTIHHRINQKLAPRFYGPFTILQKYSAVSYKLALPDTAKVHPIFHVSQLRRVTGNHTAVTDLPKDMAVTEPGFDPQDILKARQQNGVHQVLVKWEGRPEEEATWIDMFKKAQMRRASVRGVAKALRGVRLLRWVRGVRLRSVRRTPQARLGACLRRVLRRNHLAQLKFYSPI